MEIQEGKGGVKVCVTGAGGYIGSWLVKNLLQRGYTVNATLRDPQNEAKIGPLLSLPGAAERLKLFQADLCEEHAFDSAVEGCQGVFHVASPMDFSKLTDDDFVGPAVKGVMNVLNACSRAKSVRRVVYTSSIAAASQLNEEGEFLSGYSLDESRWTPVDFMRRKHQHPIGFYFVAKTLAEQAAIEYGSKSEMEVVTIGPSTVCGPCLTSTLPFSCRYLIEMAGLGNSELPQSLVGSIPLVHIDDVCEAHIFLMEQPHVEGRHICSAFSLTVSELSDIVHKLHPELSLPFKGSDEEHGSVYVPTSSKKLLDMGFSCKYGLEDMINDTVKSAKAFGLLKCDGDLNAPIYLGQVAGTVHGPCETSEGTLRLARQFLALMDGEDYLFRSKGSQMIQGLAGLYKSRAACFGFICTCWIDCVLIQLSGSLSAPYTSPTQLT